MYYETYVPMKMTEGCISLATENNARTNFSPSPTWTRPNKFTTTRRWATTTIYWYQRAEPSLSLSTQASDEERKNKSVIPL